MNLCTPAVVYFVLAIFSNMYILFEKTSIIDVIFKIVGITLWTILLNIICSNGFATLSWILVLFPFFVIFAVIISGVSTAGQDAKDAEKEQPKKEDQPAE
jgi:hypothetical protein